MAPEYTFALKIWTYNVTNADEMFNSGTKPRIVEKGPYTFEYVTLL